MTFHFPLNFWWAKEFPRVAGGEWLLSCGTTYIQGESVRSRWEIKMTTRRCLLVSVLDGTSIYLNGLEQSRKGKKNKSQLKSTYFLFSIPDVWISMLGPRVHSLKDIPRVPGYPRVSKSCIDQIFPAGTTASAFPSCCVLQIKSPGENFRGREGQFGSWQRGRLKAYGEFHWGQLRETKIVSESRRDIKCGKKNNYAA